MVKFDEVLEGIEEKLIGLEVKNNDWTEFQNGIICAIETEEYIYVEDTGDYKSSTIEMADIKVYTDDSEYTVYIYMAGNKIKDVIVR